MHCGYLGWLDGEDDGDGWCRMSEFLSRSTRRARDGEVIARGGNLFYPNRFGKRFHTCISMTYSIYRMYAFVLIMCIHLHTDVQRDISLSEDSERRVICLSALLFRCIQGGEATRFVKMYFLKHSAGTGCVRVQLERPIVCYVNQKLTTNDGVQNFIWVFINTRQRVLSPMNPVHIEISWFCKINFNIILPPARRYWKSFSLTIDILHAWAQHAASHLVILDIITLKIVDGEVNNKSSDTQFSLFVCSFFHIWSTYSLSFKTVSIYILPLGWKPKLQ
jgi:hypothetical protein